MSELKKNQLICGLAIFGVMAPLGDSQAQDLSGYDCMIEPHSVTELSTREEGVLEKVLVRRGDIVRKGQVVAKLESSLETIALDFADARAKMKGDVESKQATLEYMQRQRDRITELYEDNAISFNDKDKADTDVRLAETELQVALDNQRLMQIERDRSARRLELRSIRSPVDGVIVEILLVPGESVEDRAREIMVIAEVDPLNVEIILPAAQFGSVQVGTPADITPLLPGVPVRSAEVAVVDRTIDAASDTFRVQLQLENKDHAIPGGIRCDIAFGSLNAASNE
ncbi:MAG: efflux RND transporter periplasmic adaptor subunit [Gammaproteobacteria bacterium]|nr:efflux RND transporter periplasmic adaptor subunit [Gammaproteobacteria bacterium]